MMRREVSGLGLLEVFALAVLAVMTLGFVMSGGEDPARYAAGAGIAVAALLGIRSLQRRRRDAGATAPGPSAADPGAQEGGFGYRARQLVLALVAVAMIVAFVLVEGRVRITSAFVAILSIVLIINLERLRRRTES